MAKDAYYFSHDTNSRSDPKCSALIKDFGMEGYGIFWGIIEILAEQDGYKLEKFPKLYEGLAAQFQADVKRCSSTIEAMLKHYNLLLEDDKYIWSDSLLRRMEGKKGKIQQKIDAGRLGGINSASKRKQTSSGAQAVLQAESSGASSKPSKLKEIKLNKKEKKSEPKVSDESINLTNLLKELILENDGNAKIPENLNKWAVEIDHLIKLDKRTPDDIELVIRFSQDDKFWKSNILSAGSLRDKFPKLYLQMKDRINSEYAEDPNW